MNFDDDLPVFLADFGVDATVGSATHKVIFNKPDVVLFEDMQAGNNFTVRYLTIDFPSLHDGTAIVVAGSNFKINGEPLLLADGKFSLASLRK
jgi:hypothetical protein